MEIIKGSNPVRTEVESKDHKDQMGGMFGEFITGLGPQKRYFGPAEPISSNKTCNKFIRV